MEIREDPWTTDSVEYYCMTDCRWEQLGQLEYYSDAVVYLGKQIETNQSRDHRIVCVRSEVAIEVPSLTT